MTIKNIIGSAPSGNVMAPTALGKVLNNTIRSDGVVKCAVCEWEFMCKIQPD